MAIDEDAISLGLDPGKQELSLLLDGDVMFFGHAHDKIVSLGEARRDRPDFLDDRQAIDFDFQASPELVEREIDPVRFSDSNHETELHSSSQVTDFTLRFRRFTTDLGLCD